MTLPANTKLTGLLCLLVSFTCGAANFAIIESQSFHPLQVMDQSWQTTITNMGHTADILPQSTLENLTNLAGYDILITSSGLITIPAEYQQTMKAFVESGRNLYIQSEFSINHSGNVAFTMIANDFGGSFQWEGAQSGNVTPVNILAPLNDNLNQTSPLTYFWYGTYGSGDNTITPILENNNKYWGFIFTSPNSNHGMVMTTSDQDWIRINNNSMFLENLIFHLNSIQSVQVTPTVSIDQTNNPGCEGDSFEFQATITDNTVGVVLAWQINGQPVANANDEIFATNNVLEGDVIECVLTLNSDASYTHISNPILIAPVLPLADVTLTISADVTNICANDSVELTATGENWGDNPTFTWSVGGNVLPNNNLSSLITNTISNNQTITCSISSNADCTTQSDLVSNPIFIQISAPVTPTILVESNQIEVCAGTAVTFTASGIHWGNNAAFDWQIEGQSVSTGAPTFTTTALLPNQTVNCILTSNKTCVTTNTVTSNNVSVAINLPTTPAITIQTTDTQLCAGATATFAASGVHWGVTPSFQWSVDGSLIATTNGPLFAYNQLTDGQTVQCQVISDETCIDQSTATSNGITMSIVPVETPTVSIVADNASICNGAVINFSAQGEHWGDQVDFVWTVNGVTVNTSSAFYSAAGLTEGQQVVCNITTSLNCNGTTTISSDPITVQASNFSLQLTEISDATCGQNNGLAEFEIVGGIAPYRIQWNNGTDETFATDLAAGSYSVLVIDAGGCTSELDFEIRAIEGPEVSELVIDDAICTGGTGQAKVIMKDTVAAFTYRWINERNVIVGKQDGVAGLRAGAYRLLIADAFGCTTEESFNITETTTLEVAIAGDTEVNLGEGIRLSVEVFSNSPVTYEWKDSTLLNLTCTDCAEQRIIPTEDGNYQVVVTTASGCSMEAALKVYVKPVDGIYIPNVFSPNGDGNNDFFTAFGGNHVQQINQFEVFNRWGAKVYSAKDLTIGDEGAGWDGRVAGKVAQSGVYIYMMEIELIDGSTKLYQGDISVMK